MEDAAIFRPAKRRKFVRQHVPADIEFPDVLEKAQPPASVNRDSPEEPDISSLLKSRRQQRSRAGGIQFSNGRSDATAEISGSTALVPSESPSSRLQAITDRFIGHSGQVVDVDKHMVAYIDSEMAKRHTAHVPAPTVPNDLERQSQPLHGSVKTQELPNRQPATLGLLNEVRLNPSEARPRSNEPAPLKRRKPRLDRFGRPLRPREPRRGPTSEDIARDKLVEDIMKESGLGVYDNPESSANTPEADAGGDADSRLASQFQQQYIDQLQERQAQQKKAVPGADPGQKGPKLGGSRQQRAALREREMKEEKEKGKAG